MLNAHLFAALYPGARILMDDGKLEFIVRTLSHKSFSAEIIKGGAILSRKGVNIPDIKLNTNAMTQKDLIDLDDSDIDPIKINTKIPGKKIKSVEVLVKVEDDKS